MDYPAAVCWGEEPLPPLEVFLCPELFLLLEVLHPSKGLPPP